MQGYGVLEGNAIDQGVSAAPALNQQQEYNDIHAIKEKYVNNPIENIVPFNFLASVAPNGPDRWSQRIDMSQSPFNSIICSVVSGTLNIYLGDFMGDVSSTPHLQIPAGLPIQFMLTEKGRVVTLVNPSAAAVATGTVICCNI